MEVEYHGILVLFILDPAVASTDTFRSLSLPVVGVSQHRDRDGHTAGPAGAEY